MQILKLGLKLCIYRNEEHQFKPLELIKLAPKQATIQLTRRHIEKSISHKQQILAIPWTMKKSYVLVEEHWISGHVADWGQPQEDGMCSHFQVWISFEWPHQSIHLNSYNLKEHHMSCHLAESFLFDCSEKAPNINLASIWHCSGFENIPTRIILQKQFAMLPQFCSIQDESLVLGVTLKLHETKDWPGIHLMYSHCDAISHYLRQSWELPHVKLQYPALARLPAWANVLSRSIFTWWKLYKLEIDSRL